MEGQYYIILEGELGVIISETFNPESNIKGTTPVRGECAFSSHISDTHLVSVVLFSSQKVEVSYKIPLCWS
jgi:hypothetical protein